jgi:hypothetical protein
MHQGMMRLDDKNHAAPIGVWDIETGKEIRRFGLPEESIHAAALVDGRRVLSGGVKLLGDRPLS